MIGVLGLCIGDLGPTLLSPGWGWMDLDGSVPLHHGFPLGLFGRARGATPYGYLTSRNHVNMTFAVHRPFVHPNFTFGVGSSWDSQNVNWAADCKLLSVYSNFTLHSKLDSFDLSFIDSRYVNGCPWGVVGEVKEELCTLYIARPRKEWATR